MGRDAGIEADAHTDLVPGQKPPADSPRPTPVFPRFLRLPGPRPITIVFGRVGQGGPALEIRDRPSGKAFGSRTDARQLPDRHRAGTPQALPHGDPARGSRSRISRCRNAIRIQVRRQRGGPQPARLRAAAVHPPLSGLRARPSSIRYPRPSSPISPSSSVSPPDVLRGLWRPVPDPDRSPSGSPGPSRLSQGPSRRPEDPQGLARRAGPGARPAEPPASNSPARSSAPTRSCARA